MDNIKYEGLATFESRITSLLNKNKINFDQELERHFSRTDVPYSLFHVEGAGSDMIADNHGEHAFLSGIGLLPAVINVSVDDYKKNIQPIIRVVRKWVAETYKGRYAVSHDTERYVGGLEILELRKLHS